MVSYQWHIFWANLNPTKGSEQSSERPVLVVSSEAVNAALPIVTVLSLTSFKPGRNIYPTEVFLHKSKTSLLTDSVVMAHQIRSISRERLGQQCGMILDDTIKENIKESIRIYLDL